MDGSHRERGMNPVNNNDYHQSLEGISAEPEIKLVTLCSQVLCATDCAMELD